jgi:GNAT superfamily N-acetyltransferase
MTRHTFKESKKEIADAAKLSEEYFHTKTDSAQMASSFENYNWIHKKFPYALGIIEDNKKVVGYTILLPCREKQMDEFLLGKINEKQLVDKIRKSPAPKSFEAIYFCEAYLKPSYRRKGIAFSAMIDSAKKLIKQSKTKPHTLFYWAYSKHSHKIAEHIAAKCKMILAERE